MCFMDPALHFLKARQQMRTELRGRISELILNCETRIPTLPAIIYNILNVLRDEAASSRDLARIIRKDQSISFRLLKLANSAYYGCARQVDTLYRAIMVLGFNEVTTLAIGMSLFSSAQCDERGGLLAMNALWAHSICASMAAKSILKLLKANGCDSVKPCRELPVLMSALLHDIGKIIYTAHFQEEYANLLDTARKEKLPLNTLEEESLGMDHARLAGALMKRWNFPESVALPVLHHHSPLECRPCHTRNAMILAVSNYLAHEAGAGSSGNPLPVCPCSSIDGLGLDAGDLFILTESLKTGLQDIKGFLAAT